MHYTNAPVIIDERLRRHRGPRRALLGLGPGERHVRHRRPGSTRAWRCTPPPASARRARVEGRAVRPRRRTAAASSTASRPTEDPTLAAPALRLPAPEAALRSATRPSSSPRRAAARSSEFLEVARGALRRTRAASARARSSTRSAGRSTRSASSTSAPRRSSSCCSATSAGRAAGSWRCAGTRRSRARPTSRRSTTSCPATCRCRTPTTYGGFDDYIEANTSPTGWWGNFDAYAVEPAEGVLGRARDRRQRLLLRLPAAHRRGPLDLPDVLAHARRRRQGLHRRRREPGRRHRRTRSCTGSRWRSSTGSSCATSSRSRSAVVLARQRPRSRPASCAPRRSATEVFFLPAAAAHREGRLVHEHAAAAAVALQGGRAEGRLPLRALVLLTTSAASIREKLARSQEPRDAPVLRPALGLPDPRRASTSRAPRRCSREINGWDADGKPLSATRS